ncbi:MAG: hypothetical protein FJW90_04470 [Actinobacteria bacterium]|nr:hypothetical protein [Actinomycetota bacterium]
MRIERHRTAIRIGLVYLAATVGLVAAMILVSPRAFYDDFPTGSWAWVSALPPYNEHLLRDFGAAGLGLAVLAGLAAWWMDRRVVQAAAICLFVGSLPHAIYHGTTFESYSTASNVFSFGGLVLQTLLPLAILYLASGPRQEPAPAPAGAAGGPRSDAPA